MTHLQAGWLQLHQWPVGCTFFNPVQASCKGVLWCQWYSCACKELHKCVCILGHNGGVETVGSAGGTWYLHKGCCFGAFIVVAPAVDCKCIVVHIVVMIPLQVWGHLTDGRVDQEYRRPNSLVCSPLHPLSHQGRWRQGPCCTGKCAPRIPCIECRYLWRGPTMPGVCLTVGVYRPCPGYSKYWRRGWIVMTEQVFHWSNAMHHNVYIEHPCTPDHDMEWTHHSPLEQFQFKHCLQNHKTCIEFS